MAGFENEKTLPSSLFHCPDIKEELSSVSQDVSHAAMKEVHCSMKRSIGTRS